MKRNRHAERFAQRQRERAAMPHEQQIARKNENHQRMVTPMSPTYLEGQPWQRVDSDPVQDMRDGLERTKKSTGITAPCRFYIDGKHVVPAWAEVKP